ncbi:MAG TPA: ABC transporter ATP-binding protein [Streptosporangiaceae bacterium]
MNTAAADPPVLAADAVTCVADGRTVLDAASLTVRAGERVALMGPSGSGKTTMLTTLAGLIAPARGRVLVRGAELGATPELRRELAIILQGYGLVSLLTAAENVEIALRAAGGDPATAIDTAAATLARLGLAHFTDHLVDDLSGGQQQRVAVARGVALARATARDRAPGVLLADEPTAEQDADHRAAILTELFAVADEGTALIIATHDAEVAEMCGRTVHIDDSRVTDNAAPTPR